MQLSSSNTTDYATLLRSDEAASLEAALSFLSDDCDDQPSAGHSTSHSTSHSNSHGAPHAISDAATWRMLQDAHSSHDDLDVDIVDPDDDAMDGSSSSINSTSSHAHYAFHRSPSAAMIEMLLTKAEQRSDTDDAADDAMLSALLAAEHLPGGVYPQSHHMDAIQWPVNASSIDNPTTSDYKPQHNPGLMMAMMSAGFSTGNEFNPASLLLPAARSTASDDDSSNPQSPQSSTGSGSPVSVPSVPSAPPPATPPATTASSTQSTTAVVRSAAATKKRASKKKPAGYNSNRARDERKEELIYLRKTVNEMETRLQTLKETVPPHAPPRALLPSETKTEKAVAPPPVAAVRSTTTNQHQMSHSQSVWEDIATRQYKERRRAELENIRLKLILEGQIKMAKALEKILKKRTSLRILESVRGGGKRIKCVHRPGNDDAAIFNELLTGVAQTLAEVDAVFDANGLGRMQTAYRDAQLRHDDASGMVMEIFANKVMPFDVNATASAVWRHYGNSMDRMPSRSVYQQQPPHLEPMDDDTLVESYGLELHGSRTKGNFVCKQVMRKFVQADRIVIGWRAQAEAVDLSAEPTAGIRLVERGYTVIKALANMATPHTLVQTCYIIRPHVYDEIADQERKVGALTDFILNCVAGTISASHQMIENFLLDQALQQRK